jgi:Ca2+-binding EF-hand superfamily protein
MEAALLAVSELAGATQGGSAIQQALARAKVKEQADKMMASVDSSGDGEIDFDEFVVLMGGSFEPDDDV